MEEEETGYHQRQRALTEADIKAIVDGFNAHHSCRFTDMTQSDMNFLKDLASIIKETRSEFIKWLVKGIIYGTLILLSLVAYFKYK